MNTTTTKASSRLARIASSARAMKISIGRIGARTSCNRSVPTKKLLITVGKPRTSIRTDSAVNAPASIESRACGRNCAPASPAENTKPPNTIAPAKSRIRISTNLPGRPLVRRFRNASSSAPRMTATADLFMTCHPASGRSTPATPARRSTSRTGLRGWPGRCLSACAAPPSSLWPRCGRGR